MHKILNALGLLALCAALVAPPANAEIDPAALPIRHLNVAAADESALNGILHSHAHLMAAQTPAGSVARALGLLDDAPRPALQAHGNPTSGNFFFGPASMICLGNVRGGAGSSGCQVIKAAEQHPIYVNTPATAVAANFGNPAQFITDYSASNFSHIDDQYIYAPNPDTGAPGVGANNRYPLATSYFITYKPHQTLQESDVFAIVHAAAVAAKVTKSSGLEHIFHVFIPKGTDTCYTATACYSPADPKTFAFCGYHSEVTFSDIGTVLFTVEPYQGVKGCAIPVGYADNVSGQPTASNDLLFSAASVLAHEITETITDPLLTTGWRAEYTGPESGQEIGDICVGQWAGTVMNGHTWITQMLYSNYYYACGNGT